MNLTNVQQLTIDQVKNLIDINAEILLFDMRLENEYDSAHIPGAIHLTELNFLEEMEHITDDTKIIFYCYRGNASKVPTLDLMARGFKNVYSMEGGIMAWAKANYELVSC